MIDPGGFEWTFPMLYEVVPTAAVTNSNGKIQVQRD